MDERKPPTTVTETDPDSAEYWFQHFVQGLEDGRSATALETQKETILAAVRSQIVRIRAFNTTAPFNVKRIVEQQIQEYFHQQRKERSFQWYRDLMAEEGIPEKEQFTLINFDRYFNPQDDPTKHPAWRSRKSTAHAKVDPFKSPMAQILHIHKFGLKKSQIVVHDTGARYGRVTPLKPDDSQYRIVHFTAAGMAIVEEVDVKTKQPIPSKKKIQFHSTYLVPLEYVEAERALPKK